METIFNNMAKRHIELQKVIRENVGNCIILSKKLDTTTGEDVVVLQYNVRDEYNTTVVRMALTFKALKNGTGYMKKPIKEETLGRVTRRNFIH